MSASGLGRLKRRARRVRAAHLVRSFEYRQRHHARGVWARLRRLLSDASSAWRLSEEDARLLMAEGFAPDPVGLELEPAIRIFFLTEERLQKTATRTPLPLRLGAELLTTRYVALVRWP